VPKLEVAYIETVNTISVTLNGRFRSLNLHTDQGRKLSAAVRENPQDLDKIAEIADIATYITRHTFGRVIVDDKDRLRLDGKVVDYGLSEIILRLLTEGAEVGHLTKFLENVSQNPDPEVAPHLYSFLQKGGMPITPDGCFHAFKKVDEDYRSFHTGNEDVTVIDALGVPTNVRGRIPHPVGGVLIMDREVCNPNRGQTCSVGLHACSPYYLESWYGGRGRLLIVKIDPKDVTAIPNDYNDAKLRTCRLEVVAEIPEEDARTHFTKALESRYTPPEATISIGGEVVGTIESIEINDDAADADVSTEVLRDEFLEGRQKVTGQITVHFVDPEVLKQYEQGGGDLNDFMNRILEEVDLKPCENCTCGADGRMTLDQAVKLGITDGENAADEHTDYFDCEPEDGLNYDEVPEHLEMAYLIAFASAYVEAWELEDFYSQSAYDQGVEDSKALASQHLEADLFNPDASYGANYEEVPETHEDAYCSGFVVGYLGVFLGGDNHSEIADAVDAELEPNFSGDGVVGD
jgi:hypothetical protein